MKRLWTAVVHDPVVFKTINGWMTVFWIVMIPVSVVMGWVSTVEYVSALSIYALVTGHLSTWQSARVEANQEAEERRRQAEHEVDAETLERKVHELHEALVQRPQP